VEDQGRNRRTSISRYGEAFIQLRASPSKLDIHIQASLGYIYETITRFVARPALISRLTPLAELPMFSSPPITQPEGKI
jgi:hypothetical protein